MTDDRAIIDAVWALHRPCCLRESRGRLSVVESSAPPAPIPGYRTAWAPAASPADLGDAGFCADHRIRFPYVAGAMANGIGSCEIVEAMAHGGMLGFFGAAGLPLERVEAAIVRLQDTLGNLSHGFNLIHSPNEPDLEDAVVDLYLKHGVRLVEASAYLDLTLPVVRYRLHGISTDAGGRVLAPNRVIVKVSRVEVASKFFAPAPEKMVAELVRRGELTEQQASVAARLPVAQDMTAEADSGGHTDNRPALALMPTILALRDRLQDRYGFEEPLRVGAAGGISTPASVAAAFAMGAAYVLTGSINQACVESGSSDVVRAMLSEAGQADVTMAPAADMFEMGVKVQVLKRGTMFAMRAAKLYELFRAYAGLDQIPVAECANLEKNVFRAPIAAIWDDTVTYFQTRDPSQIERAERDPKHKMALVFRWYLGQSSRWANAGDPPRKLDYQIWCGPGMGAFNEWVKDSFLEDPRRRHVVPVAQNLLYGGAVLQRIQQLRSQGISLPSTCSHWRPLEPAQLEERLNSMRIPA